MTPLLQPIDCCAVCCFKRALRRLIVVHVVSYVDKTLALSTSERPTLRIMQVITACTALKLIAEAWDLVPRRVVLKAWLEIGSLAPHQAQEVDALLVKHNNSVKKTIKPQRGSDYGYIM